MKRVIACAITLGLAFALFPFIQVNAAVNPTFGTSAQTQLTVNNVTAYFYAVQLKAPLDGFTVEWNATDGTDYSYNHVQMVVRLTIANNNSYPVRISSLNPRFQFQDSVASSIRGIVDIQNMTNELYLTFNDSDSYIELAPSVDYSEGAFPNVPPKSSINAIAVITLQAEAAINQTSTSGFIVPVLSGVNFYNNTFNVYQATIWPNGNHGDITNELQEISEDLQQILDSMSSGDYSDTVSDSEALQTQEESIHQQEAQWYSDNQTAIEATGLGNYQYNNGFISAFGIARQQISLLWNAMGDWTYVYYLVFLLGLATYILRHEPTMKAKQARAAAAQAQKERTEYYRSHKK